MPKVQRSRVVAIQLVELLKERRLRLSAQKNVDGSGIVLITVLIEDGIDKLSIKLRNLGASDLTGFQIEYQVSPETGWDAIENTGTDWTAPAPKGFIKYGRSDPTTLGAGLETLFYMIEIGAWYAIRFVASIDAGATAIAIDVKGGG